jgi:YidC/Oxa1 family membrane protein insertase
MFDWFFTALQPLEYAVASIMVAWHTVLTRIGMPAEWGWTWALSIVGLVVVIRILLIPLFVRQIHASRKMQLIQPQMKKIQEKYKGKSDPASRQAMQQETMALYRESGTNPFSSCLPILLQSPVFFALFRVLNGIPQGKTIGPLNAELVHQADQATILGAPLSATFVHAPNTATRIVTVILIILMSLTTFTTQRQLMTKNMPASALDNPFARQQKALMYILPLFFAISGINFPIGVLIYWLTTNLWSMGQQFYVIRRMPAPGSLAEKALEERRRQKTVGARKEPALEPGAEPDASSSAVVEPPRGGQRQQPKRQNRAKRGSPRTPTPAASKRPGEGSQRPGKSR